MDSPYGNSSYIQIFCEKLLRFLDFFALLRKLILRHFCSSGGRGGILDTPLHNGRAVVSLSNSKRRRRVRNSAFAFRYFGSRCSAVNTFGFSLACEPLASSFSDLFFILIDKTLDVLSMNFQTTIESTLNCLNNICCISIDTHWYRRLQIMAFLYNRSFDISNR